MLEVNVDAVDARQGHTDGGEGLRDDVRAREERANGIRGAPIAGHGTSRRQSHRPDVTRQVLVVHANGLCERFSGVAGKLRVVRPSRGLRRRLKNAKGATGHRSLLNHTAMDTPETIAKQLYGNSDPLENNC